MREKHWEGTVFKPDGTSEIAALQIEEQDGGYLWGDEMLASFIGKRVEVIIREIIDQAKR